MPEVQLHYEPQGLIPDLLSLSHKPKNYVPPKGNPLAKIAVIGQAPGEKDQEKRTTFSGLSGGLIHNCLTKAGLSFDDCWYTNISKIRPAFGEFGSFSENQIDGMVYDLQQELNELPNLTTAVVCGGIPLHILGHHNPISSWRGSVFASHVLKNKNRDPLKLVATYNPAEILYPIKDNKNKKQGKATSSVMVADLKRAKEQGEFCEIPTPEYNFIYPESVDDITYWLKEHRGELVCVDTETYQPLRISCLSIATSEKDCLSIPYEKGRGVELWEKRDELRIWEELNKFLMESPIIIQNAMYDYFVFWWLGFRIPPENLWMDTMLAHHCLFMELPHGLDFLCSMYTFQEYYKDELKLWKTTDDYSRLTRYNCLDSACTFKVAMALAKELEEAGQWDFYREQYLSPIRGLIRGSLRGIPIHEPTRQKIKSTYLDAQATLQHEVNKFSRRELNVGSNKQMIQYLYTDLKYEEQFKTKKDPKTGEKFQVVTADETALQKLAKKYESPELRTIIHLRRVRKVISTYVDFFLDRDGRIRCSFNLMGTTSGRISEGKAPTGSGMTLHNLPREGSKVVLRGKEVRLPDIKSCFFAEPGHAFVIPDYKQAEVFLVAMLAEEDALLDLLLSGADIHKTIASRYIYNKPMESITKDERYLAKRIVHACNYGMSWFKFSELMAKEERYLQAKEVKRMIGAYHRAFPNIQRRFHKYVEMELIANRKLTNSFGRTRLFFGKLDDETFRTGYAQIPQSTVSDLLNRALDRVETRFPISGQQHDSLWAMVPIEGIAAAIPWMWKQMEIPVKWGKYEVVIPADCKYGIKMGEMTEYNPKEGIDTAKLWKEWDKYPDMQEKFRTRDWLVNHEWEREAARTMESVL